MISRLSDVFWRISLGRPPTFHRAFVTSLLLKRGCPDISTLNPTHLSRNDLCNFSGMVAVSLPEEGVYTQRFKYSRVGKVNIPFPMSCRGFLYYWTHPDLPAGSGGIRFRITPEGEPSLFSLGKDLCLPNGSPWSIPLHKLVEGNGELLRLLLKDKLVDRNLIGSEYIRALLKLRLKKDSVLLQSLEESFPLCLPQGSVRLHLLSEHHQAEKVLFSFKPMPEFRRLVEPGQQVYAHVRLEVTRRNTPTNRLRVRFRILRVFEQGILLDGEFPPIECRSVVNVSAFKFWLQDKHVALEI
ncbi:uncharacterized protein BT62DRAFT_307322 [Guyanagaster necrorhizus]|uniref:Uncharacterized protein n=1 Tax=Guyanagaster necrorhizus TaxID=856835 RepID=A0A9P8AQ43_9AGAR|nr:uncharacterized protein BT62DRAFT_307322 [Guyanagaster necrorhizus MCA 3950]KAG7443988.1 hypothetical protein BT62DRAFT_307322 [Guyanagaster necrorhizus MCA 3950]